MNEKIKTTREARVIQKASSLIDEFETIKKNKMPLVDGNEYVVVLDISLRPVIPVGLMAANPSIHKKLSFDTEEKGAGCSFDYVRTVMGRYAIYIRENYLNLNLVEE